MGSLGVVPNFGQIYNPDSFTGNGSTTTFTLSHGVTSDQSILWIESGVTQKPGIDYTISGLTLTRTTAPANGVACFAMYLGVSIDIGTPGDGTVTLAKLAATGTASSSTFLRGDNAWAAAGSPSITDNGNANAITISSDEEVTMPKQPCFYADVNTGLSNQTGNGSEHTMVWDVERFDQNADFDGTSTFTAPATGKYLFSASVRWQGVTSAADTSMIRVNTSNEFYENFYQNVNSLGANEYLQISVICDMDAADTCTIISSGTGESGNVWDISGGGQHNRFSACLLA